ncbi:MAG: aldo/keto reductase [Eubacterium sp.]|nr:aldo/keto reductase [Eubacterium sp.]
MKEMILSNGVKIPCFGYGTFRLSDEESCVKGIRDAVETGYRLIDTASFYKNEEIVGRGIRKCGLPREELFITTKVWASERGYKPTLESFETSMKKLGLEYLDLFLIHWPTSEARFPDWEELNRGSWQALTELYKQGRVRSIGVSNFLEHHLKALMETEIRPMVNQLEIHPGYPQLEIMDYCQKNGIVVEAWSPLGRQRVAEEELLVSLAEKYGRTVSQICLRWCVQHGTIPIPKTSRRERMEENLNVFDFEITDEDMAAIDAMPECGWSGEHPDTVPF